jgi:hypothetical protein
VLVKEDGTRFCIDYQDLNRKLVAPGYTSPRCDEAIRQRRQAGPQGLPLLLTLDLASVGYPVAEEHGLDSLL